MINWMYFPQTQKIEPHLIDILDVFKKHSSEISSENHKESNLISDEVLHILSDDLEKAGYNIERSKNPKTK